MIGVEEYGSEKILIPWAISKEVAKKTGVIQFSFQFFKLSEIYASQPEPFSKYLTLSPDFSLS